MNWNEVGRGLELPVTPERVERISKVLDELLIQTRKVLREDLGLVEPVGSFTPRGRRLTAQAGQAADISRGGSIAGES